MNHVIVQAILSISSSLRNKLILIFITIIIVPLCFLVYISYHNFANNIQESYINNNKILLTQINSQFDDYFKQLENISLSMYTDLLFSPEYRLEENDLQIYNLKMKKLLSIYLQKKETNSVIFYMPSNKEVYIINRLFNNSFQNAQVIENYEWYKNSVKAGGNIIIEPAHMIKGYPHEYQLNSNDLVFSTSRSKGVK